MTVTTRRPKSVGRTVTKVAAIVAGVMVAVLAFCRAAAANRESFSRSLVAPLSGHFVRVDDVELLCPGRRAASMARPYFSSTAPGRGARSGGTPWTRSRREASMPSR